MTTPDIEHQDQEPTDEQLRSDEARKYRQKLRDSEAAGARLVEDIATVNARNEALERQLAETHLRGKLNDPADMWLESKLDDLRGEDGVLDVDKLNARADELLADHPHWRAPSYSTPSHLVNARGVPGGRPRNALDTDNVTPAPERGWAGFLQDAARGEGPPPT